MAFRSQPRSPPAWRWCMAPPYWVVGFGLFHLVFGAWLPATPDEEVATLNAHAGYRPKKVHVVARIPSVDEVAGRVFVRVPKSEAALLELFRRQEVVFFSDDEAEVVEVRTTEPDL